MAILGWADPTFTASNEVDEDEADELIDAEQGEVATDQVQHAVDGETADLGQPVLFGFVEQRRAVALGAAAG